MDEPNNLLACPFCGGEPTQDREAVQCYGCGARIGSKMASRETVRKWWNRRAGAHELGATDGKAVGCSAWLEELTKTLRTQAKEIAAAGHNGWGNTMTAAADEIDKLRAQIEGSSSDKMRGRET